MRPTAFISMNASILLALVLAAGCGSTRPSGPAATPATSLSVITSSVLPPGWLPLEQRRMVELATFGGSSPVLRTQSIPTFVPGAEIGLIHVVQLTDKNNKYPTTLEVRDAGGKLVWTASGSGSYDVTWQGLDGDNNSLPGGTYTVKLKKNGTYRVIYQEPDGTLDKKEIAIAQLTLEVITHEGLQALLPTPSPS